MAALELCQPACFTDGVNLTKRKRGPVCLDSASNSLLAQVFNPPADNK